MELQFDVSEENKEQKDIVLAPLEPNIEIRTMKSDIKALKESGGDLTNIAVEETTPPIAQAPVSDRPIFEENLKRNGNNPLVIKIVLIIIGVLILAAGIGFASYYLASKIL